MSEKSKKEETKTSSNPRGEQQTFSAEEQGGPSRENRTSENGSSSAARLPNWGGDRRDIDDDSFRYMSEPSLSEDCDSSTADRRSLLSPTSGEDDEDEGEGSTPPPPPPGPPPPLNTSAASSGMASPGNTSLSSWESHFRPPNSRMQRVKIHFSPDHPAQSDRSYYPYLQPYQQQQYAFQQPPFLQRIPQETAERSHNTQPLESAANPPHSIEQHVNEAANASNLSYSTFSYSTLSSVSPKGRKRLGTFISDLRNNSEGALQEAESHCLLNTSADSSLPRATLNTVLRSTPVEQTQDDTQKVPGRHRRISSVDTELIGNTSDIHLEEHDDKNDLSDSKLGDTSSHMLNFSASEDDEGDHQYSEKPESQGGHEWHVSGSSSDAKGSGISISNKSNTRVSESSNTGTHDDHHRVDSDPQQHSADDEQTQFRPPRKRVFNVAGGKPSPAHRRTRSGDSAAAALATGGKDWKGMDKDKIPLPIADDDEEDEDLAIKSKNSKGETEQEKNGGKTKNGKKITSNNDAPVFSVGSDEAVAADRAAARKQRREQRHEQRHEQRLLAERAAAAATERKIQHQYQEFSKSPLWNYNQYHRARMDSHDSHSLGSIPSTIMHAMDDSMHDETGRPQHRSSLDTKTSTISSSTSDYGGPNRRDSESMFSWISNPNNGSASQQGNEAGLPLSPSPYAQRRSLQFQPQRLQHRSPPVQSTRHLRSHTEIGDHAYYYNYSRALDPQRQESFRRHLELQREIPSQDSLRRFSYQQYSPASNGSYSAHSLPGPPQVSTESQDSYHSVDERAGQSRGNSSSTSSSGNSSTHSSEEDDEFRDIHFNQVHQMHPNTFNSLDEVERSVEGELLRHGSYQHVLRHARHSPFANFGRKNIEDTASKKFDKASFLPRTSVMQDGGEEYPTYRCPRCQTVQREFFTVSNAPKQYETASGYLALYFCVYVIASLYIFGMEENWPAIDCIYFAVITLTTAGLGDFVPTSDGNKVICSIFIYFGVACIGLLLGTYIAGMLDESSRRQAKENRLKSCPNCARLQNIKDVAEKRQLSMQASMGPGGQATPSMFSSERPSGFGNDPVSFASERVSVPSDQMEQEHAAQLISGQKKFKRQHGRESSQDSTSSTPSCGHQGSSTISETNSALGGNKGSAPPVFPSSSYISPALISKKTVVETPSVPARISEDKETIGETSPTLNIRENARPSPPPPPPIPNAGSNAKQTVPKKRASPPSALPRSPGLPLGSPMTQEILGRQSHTRHASIDINGGFAVEPLSQIKGARKYSFDAPTILTPTIAENSPFVPGTTATATSGDQNTRSSRASAPNLNPPLRYDSAFTGTETGEDDSSVVSADSYTSEESDINETTKTRVKTAKYVFLTLKQALVNSLVIIGVGCIGFWFIERFSIVDSWYFTTVLLTTVGYGDIVPVTKGGKLFATVYILVAGTILLNNMSMISMIPLELRKRRIERAVLTQFGDLLDDDALRELASGPLIQRLRLATNRADGLDECTREMFALAMLVRLGKVTEDDVLETFEAFNRLDVNRDGVLNSRSIIAGMIHKHRNQANSMRRVASTNSMLKRSQMPPAPMYSSEASTDYTTNLNISPSYWTPTPTPTPMGYDVRNQQMNSSAGFGGDSPAFSTETSSLLRSGGGYGAHTRSRSG